MSKITILDNETIDKIAAGEVVERPLNVVKELVENSIDSKATSIHVEIKEGGVSLIRITDNGSGIASDDVETAFCRHATSKINNVNDLLRLQSLGFRGEALSSIAAICNLNCITKVSDELTATSLEISGGKIISNSQIGAPNGTTFIIKDLFFNVPVRRGFLKSANVEAAAITELIEQLAFSNPNIAFHYTINGKQKFYTTGKGDVKENIYNIYGMQIAKELLPIKYDSDDINISGFIGLPAIAKANRSSEHYFVNGRFVKSKIISQAIEEAYDEFLMQHRYPFTMIYIKINPMLVDVNIHPSKMEVKFIDEEDVRTIISTNIKNSIKYKDIIPEVTVGKNEVEKHIKVDIPEPFEVRRIETSNASSSCWSVQKNQPQIMKEQIDNYSKDINITEATEVPILENEIIQKSEQISLFKKDFLTKEARKEYEILGQVFLTYWLIAYNDKLYIMDQHAAHEKVKYERFVAQLKDNRVESQNLLVPIIITLNPQEEEVVKNNLKQIEELGYIVESFGGKEYSIRSIPCELFGSNEEEAFREILKYFIENKGDKTPSAFYTKCASLGCKAAVKGNYKLNTQQVEVLLDELLTLDNPYHCPHGRPTIITITKYEMEKKFKRIV